MTGLSGLACLLPGATETMIVETQFARQESTDFFGKTRIHRSRGNWLLRPIPPTSRTIAVGSEWQFATCDTPRN